MGTVDCPLDDSLESPLLAGKGATVLCRGNSSDDADLELASEMFSASGMVVFVEESLMDAVTALSGSGPAYLFLLVEAMTEAGVEQGLSLDVAARLARQTAIGAAALLESGDLSPAELRRRVTSPGGTTEAAISYMEESDFAEIMKGAIRRAAERSKELGG